MESGHGWDLYVKKKDAKPAEPAKTPSSSSPGGAEELPGTPRPKPGESKDKGAGKTTAPTSEDAEFRAQKPGAVEEDAEIWDSKRGWIKPTGEKVGEGEGYVKPEGEGPRVDVDEDTEIQITPRKAPSAQPMRPRTGGPMAQAGLDGRDFHEYVKPLVPEAAPPSPPPKPVDAKAVHVQELPKGTLNVLLVGSGAREHAMAAAITRSRRAQLFVVTKHRNPGLTKLASAFKIMDDRDAQGIVAWAKQQRIHVAVMGPESALEAGVTDALRAAGIAVASPSQAAARIETSKTFMRDLMHRYNLPGQLGFYPFSKLPEALAFLDKHGPVWAIKPVGLTGGKGVQVYGDHFRDVEGAKAYVKSIFAGGAGGGAVQFEELAVGEEFTLMAFSDGKDIQLMPAVQDHKRLRDGDQGPNTGGMGSYTQADGLLPFLTADEYSEAARIVHGIVQALDADGCPYVGTIYGQFMLTADGPKIIEVNARFGDPEAMNVLHLLETDYVEILAAMALGRLTEAKVGFRRAATVVKYIVPATYGSAHVQGGGAIEVDEFNVKRCGGAVYYGSVEQLTSGALATLTSRTLGVLGEGPDIAHANAVCEASLKHIHGQNLFVRHDIASPQLLEKRVARMNQVRAARTEKGIMGIRKRDA